MTSIKVFFDWARNTAKRHECIYGGEFHKGARTTSEYYECTGRSPD